jgi:hypothetical protein
LNRVYIWTDRRLLGFEDLLNPEKINKKYMIISLKCGSGAMGRGKGENMTPLVGVFC